MNENSDGPATCVAQNELHDSNNLWPQQNEAVQIPQLIRREAQKILLFVVCCLCLKAAKKRTNASNVAVWKAKKHRRGRFIYRNFRVANASRQSAPMLYFPANDPLTCRFNYSWLVKCQSSCLQALHFVVFDNFGKIKEDAFDFTEHSNVLGQLIHATQP